MKPKHPMSTPPATPTPTRRTRLPARAVATAALLAVAGLPTDGSMAATRDDVISVVDVDNVQWRDYPGLPGVKFVVIDGDPSKAGEMYTIRVKFAPNTMSQPHWHPEKRYVTVLKGTWWAGTGPKFDAAATSPVKAGGFGVHTAKEIHYDGAKDEEVMVQISGIGPSGTIPVNSDGTDRK